MASYPCNARTALLQLYEVPSCTNIDEVLVRSLPLQPRRLACSFCDNLRVFVVCWDILVSDGDGDVVGGFHCIVSRE